MVGERSQSPAWGLQEGLMLPRPSLWSLSIWMRGHGPRLVPSAHGWAQSYSTWKELFT